MEKLSGWKKKLIEKKAKGEMVKMYKKSEKQLQDIKERIGELIDSKEEREQLNMVIILCTEIIVGFEEVGNQEFILEMIKETIKNINMLH